MRTFEMLRQHDESGVSGTGTVLEGTIFSCGETVIRWRGNRGSVNVFHSFDDFLQIHVMSHPTNGTALVFNNGEVQNY